MKTLSLTGACDLHIHSSPDIVDRIGNDVEIARRARDAGMRAIVYKCVLEPTVSRAWHTMEQVEGISVFGGIVPDHHVGGINPSAVEPVIKMGGKVVWLPTNTAANHFRKENKEGGVEIIKDGQVTEELRSVFERIKEHDAVLATGHISPEECFRVTEAARDAGVKKIVITHPEFHIVGMSLEDQIRIVKDYDVMLERVYAQPIGGGVYKNNLPDNVEAIRAVGCDHIIVSTDSGQMQNPPWYESIVEYVEYLRNAGITEAEIEKMTQINPGRMLGIEK